jgi:hypothetical protein
MPDLGSLHGAALLQRGTEDLAAVAGGTTGSAPDTDCTLGTLPDRLGQQAVLLEYRSGLLIRGSFSASSVMAVARGTYQGERHAAQGCSEGGQ